MSIPFLHFFSNASFEWIQKDIEHSHLDRYYLFMASLSVGNDVIYYPVSYWYADDAFLEGDGVDEPIAWFPSGLGEDVIPEGDEELGVIGGLIHGVVS